MVDKVPPPPPRPPQRPKKSPPAKPPMPPKPPAKPPAPPAKPPAPPAKPPAPPKKSPSSAGPKKENTKSPPKRKPKPRPKPKKKPDSKGQPRKKKKRKSRRINIKLGLRQKKITDEKDTYSDQIGWTSIEENFDDYEDPTPKEPEIVNHQCSMCGAMMRIPRPKRERYKVICAHPECGHSDMIGI